MQCRQATRTERAQLAMMLEVSAPVKPGNVDRGHDYGDTWLEHFLASTIFARPAFEMAEASRAPIGPLIRKAVADTNCHSGGNTHFGAFILLIPLIAGGDIEGACHVCHETTVEDAIAFYEAFGLTEVRANKTDALDVNDPAALEAIRKQGMTLYDIMAYSAPRDMVAREWTNDFSLTRRAADLLLSSGKGREAVQEAFMELLASETDTFVVKKLGTDMAEETRRRASEVLAGDMYAEDLDRWCLSEGVNPGSTADIIIAGIYVALMEGWQWDS